MPLPHKPFRYLILLGTELFLFLLCLTASISSAKRYPVARLQHTKHAASVYNIPHLIWSGCFCHIFWETLLARR